MLDYQVAPGFDVETKDDTFLGANCLSYLQYSATSASRLTFGLCLCVSPSPHVPSFSRGLSYSQAPYTLL